MEQMREQSGALAGAGFSGTRARENQSRMAVVIINFNARDHLQRCLASVDRTGLNEIVVVDNASTDGSREMICREFPHVYLIQRDRNVGYGTAANEAIAACRAEYILLLNCDILVPAEAACALTAYLDQHPRAAIVGPRLLHVDGACQASYFPFPTPLNLLLAETRLGQAIGSLEAHSKVKAVGSNRAAGDTVPWVLGAALAIRREAFEAIGGFDLSFFMYCEEIDLCYRAWKSGWQVHFAPVVSIVHVGAASTSQQPEEMAVELYFSQNRFYRLHYSKWQLRQLRLITTDFMLRNTVRDSLKRYQSTNSSERAKFTRDVRVWQRILNEQWKW